MARPAELGPAGVCRRARPAAPFIERGGGHGHPLAHLHDRVQCLLRVDELVLTAHRYSWAKKAAAFPKNSVFIRNSRTSRSSSRSRARSATLNAGSSSTCSTRSLFSQFPRVPSLTCMSRAISVIGSDVSITEIARDIHVNEGTLGNWVNKYRTEHVDDEPALSVSERARLRELEREVRELRMKTEFLGKAAAFFAQEYR